MAIIFSVVKMKPADWLKKEVEEGIINLLPKEDREKIKIYIDSQVEEKYKGFQKWRLIKEHFAVIIATIALVFIFSAAIYFGDPATLENCQLKYAQEFVDAPDMQKLSTELEICKEEAIDSAKDRIELISLQKKFEEQQYLCSESLQLLKNNVNRLQRDQELIKKNCN